MRSPSAAGRLVLALLAGVAADGLAVGRDDVTAVSAQASPGYSRVRLPNGDFKPESYVFAEGGEWKGAMQDRTIDKMASCRALT